MILVLQVLNNRLTAKISLLEDLVYSLEVVPNQGLFEQVVSIVDFTSSHLALSSEVVDGVAHEEGDVDGLLKGAEHAGGLSLAKDVLEVGGGGVNKSVLLVEAAGFDSLGLFNRVDDLEILVGHEDALF